MRRWLGVIVAIALVAVLYPRIAFAAFQTTLSNSVSDNFGAQIFQRAFDEVPSRNAAFAADTRVAESFFREYALRVGAIPTGSGMAQIAIPSGTLPLLSSNLFRSARITGGVTHISASDYRVPTIATSDLTGDSPDSSVAPVIGLYRDASPAPTTGPASFRFDLTSSRDNAQRVETLSPTLNPQEAFTAGAAGPDPATSLPQAQAGLAVPVRVGHVRMQPHVEGAQSDVPSLALKDNAVNTGATFNTRVGAQKFDIDVSSGFEHLTLNDPTLNSSSFDQTANVQMGDGKLPVLIPAYADVSKHTVAAGVGVPVARNVTLNVQAETQHLLGGYGAPGLSNLDARNNVYGGKVTFQLPHAASVSLSAKQYRYQDNLTPTTFTQTSANVNFTVKF